MFKTWRLGKEKRVLARDGYSGRFLSSGASGNENSADRQGSIWACREVGFKQAAGKVICIAVTDTDVAR